MTDSTERACDNCLHAAKKGDEWPCRGCGFEYGNGAFDKWEPARAAAPQAQPCATTCSKCGHERGPLQACMDEDCPPQAQPAPAERGECTLCGSTEHRETCDSPGAILTFTTGCPVHDAKCRALARSPEPAPVSDERIREIWIPLAALHHPTGTTPSALPIAFARALLAEKGTP